MIDISLLGKVEFTVNGKDAMTLLSSTRKGSQLLYYLILNYGKSVSSTLLYEAIWPGEVSTNPESALKTMVSRLRASLSEFDGELKKCITTDRGAYRWNTELDCSIDILRVEQECERILSYSADCEQLKSDINDLLFDYSGDLTLGGEDDSIFAVKRAHFHSLFLDAILHAISLYKQTENYQSIIQLCRSALDIDAFDEQVHMELMEALVKSNRSGEALSQYRHMSNLHYSYLGVAPSDNLQNFYKQISKADQSLGMDIESIRRSLEESESHSGAFVCEYAIFKDVYQLQMRNLQRLGTTMFLAIIMLAPAGQNGVEAFELDKSMHQLLNIMVPCLRKGDTITRYSPSQFALLLPSVNASTGRMVIKRIRSAYYAEHVNPALVFSYKLTPVGAPHPKQTDTEEV